MGDDKLIGELARQLGFSVGISRWGRERPALYRRGVELAHVVNGQWDVRLGRKNIKAYRRDLSSVCAEVRRDWILLKDTMEARQALPGILRLARDIVDGDDSVNLAD